MHKYCPFPGRKTPHVYPKCPPIPSLNEVGRLNKKPDQTANPPYIQEVPTIKFSSSPYRTELQGIIDTLSTIVESKHPLRHSFKTLESQLLAFPRGAQDKKDTLFLQKIKNCFTLFIPKIKAMTQEPSEEELELLSKNLSCDMQPLLQSDSVYISKCLSTYFEGVRSITTCRTGPCISPIDERILYLNRIFEQLMAPPIEHQLIESLKKIQDLLFPFLISLDDKKSKEYDDLRLFLAKQLYLMA
ncbi:MAG: hypothetical protein RLZZ453_92 [Chlamydiota bacterium]|jgi:hypothetical protein